MMLAAAPSGGGVPNVTWASSMATLSPGLMDTSGSSRSRRLCSLTGNDTRAGMHDLTGLYREVTGGDVPRRVAEHRDEGRIVDGALRLGLRASRVEPATRRRVDR